MYPSAPLLLIQWTATAFPSARVGIETPANLQQVLTTSTGFIRIQRSGGARRFTIDNPNLDVDVWALDVTTADALCGAVCTAWEWQMPGVTIEAGQHGRSVVARVAITSGPSERPTADTTLSRVGASAAVSLHSA